MRARTYRVVSRGPLCFALASATRDYFRVEQSGLALLAFAQASTRDLSPKLYPICTTPPRVPARDVS